MLRKRANERGAHNNFNLAEPSAQGSPLRNAAQDRMFQNKTSFSIVLRGLCAIAMLVLLVGVGFITKRMDKEDYHLVDRHYDHYRKVKQVNDVKPIHRFKPPKLDSLPVKSVIQPASPDDDKNNKSDYAEDGHDHGDDDTSNSIAKRKNSSSVHTTHGENILPIDNDEEDIHIVFSTDCSEFQHWQSYLLFYSAYRIKQPGKITRIASGCTDEQEKEELNWHLKHISSVLSDKFMIHFTPHFSAVKDQNGNTKGDYKFFNKPMGLQHWLEHGDGMGISDETGLPKNEHTLIALLDPDMILLKHISSNFSNEKMILVSKKAKDGQKVKVEHGSPFGQQYGLGTQWQSFGLDVITGDPDSNAKKVSRQDAAKYYPVGPPYLATARDMYRIAQKWVEFVPRVHAEYPYLLAEMYAYCIAAAHLDLPHQLVDHMMVSNTGIGGEGWPFVDNLTKNSGANTACELMNNGSIESLHSPESTLPLPTVIHFCQRYIIGNNFFGKRKVPKQFFTCEHPLLAIPSDDLDTLDYKFSTDSKTKNEKQLLRSGQNVREAFVICTVTRVMNEAAEFFKNNGCDVNDPSTNLEKTLNMHDLF